MTRPLEQPSHEAGLTSAPCALLPGRAVLGHSSLTAHAQREPPNEIAFSRRRSGPSGARAAQTGAKTRVERNRADVRWSLGISRVEGSCLDVARVVCVGEHAVASECAGYSRPGPRALKLERRVAVSLGNKAIHARRGASWKGFDRVYLGKPASGAALCANDF